MTSEELDIYLLALEIYHDMILKDFPEDLTKEFHEFIIDLEKRWVTIDGRHVNIGGDDDSGGGGSSSGGQNNTKYTDVKNEYQKKATPGVGKIICDDNYDFVLHKEEIDFANWLHSYYGGDIKLLNEVNQNKILTADYLWNGKLWDLKTTTTEISANSAVRKGLKQIASNPGGIMLNYGQSEISISKLQDVIDKRMQWYKGATVDIMIVSKNKAIKILRYK